MARIPERIARYRIVERIGAGGMGAVYRAVQDEPRRDVALKVLRGDSFSPEMARRFQVEAEALGRLLHPGIAQVYEAGTYDEDGETRPFFAMEFVAGPTLLEWATSRGLELRGRLELIERIARAVEHAHQRGVIHRDLKPDNILVDASGQPKILDFGVARVTDADLEAASMLTDVGQVIGTLPYMSPEQASGDPEALDTRSDVYALGVVAFELITGRLPIVLRGGSLVEALRRIREQEPVRAGTVNTRLRGDVETILGKALAKEKEQRYASAAALADDVRRHLADQPIDAHPPSTWYQVSKFARRHRTLVGGVVAVFLALAVGLVASLTFYVKEAAALEEAGESLQEADEVLEFVVDMLAQASPEGMGIDARVRDVLDASSSSVGERFAARPRVEARLRGAMGSLYAGLTVYENAEAHLRRALDLQRELFGAEHERVLSTEQRLARFYLRSLQPERAGELFARLLDVRGRVPFADPAAALDFALDHGRFALMTRDHATAERQLGSVADAEHASAEQRVNALEGLAELAQVKGDDPIARERFEQALGLARDRAPGLVAFVQYHLARLHMEARRVEEAEALLRTVIAARRERKGAVHVDTAVSMRELALILVSMGRLDDAERLIREALAALEVLTPEGSIERLTAATTLARILRSRGDATGALDLLRPRIEAAEARGDLASVIALARSEYGMSLCAAGRAQEAIPIFAAYVAMLDDAPELTQALVVQLQNLGMAQARAGRSADAVASFRRAVERARALWPEPHALKGAALHRMGQVERQLGNADAAQRLHEEALEIRRAVLPADHQDIASSLTDLGFLLKDRGQYQEALPYFEQAHGIDVRVGGENWTNALVSASNLADVLARLRRYDEAEALLEPTVRRVRAMSPPPARFLGVTMLRRGKVLRALGRDADAIPVLEEARGLLLEVSGPDDGAFKAVTGMLIDALEKVGRAADAAKLRQG